MLANDSDAEADVLNAALVTAPGNGTLALQADGSFVFTPDAGFTGTDAFQYRVSDGADNSAPITVSLLVTASVAPIADSRTVAPTPELEPEPEPETSSQDTETPSPEVEPLAVDQPGSSVSAPASEKAVTPAIVQETASAPAFLAPSAPAAQFLTIPIPDDRRLDDGPERAARVLDSTEVDARVSPESLKPRSNGGLDFGDEDLSFLIDTHYLARLESVDDEIQAEAGVQTLIAGSAVVTGTGLSVGYIVWMIRGGYLMASLMSVLPVWQDVDPLYVLDGIVDDDDEDDSLQEMIEKSEKKHDELQLDSDWRNAAM